MQIYSQSANAFEQLSIEIQQLKAKDWQVNEASLSLINLDKKTPQLVLFIKQLSLPKPLSKIDFFDIQCQQFTWQNNKIDCQQGKAKLKSPFFHSSAFTFSFSLTEKLSSFQVKHLKFANGELSLKAKQKANIWSVSINTKGLHLQKIHQLLSKLDIPIDDISKGKVDADIKLLGNKNGVTKVLINTNLKKVSMQANEQFVTNALDVQINLTAKFKKSIWEWENKIVLRQGELYVDPVYLALGDQEISLDSKGSINKQDDIQLQQLQLIHSGVYDLKAHGLITNSPVFNIESAHVDLSFENLEQFSALYFSPFTEQKAIEGISFSGDITSQIDIAQSSISQLTADLSNFSIKDTNKRFAIKNAKGVINWSIDPSFFTSSWLSWKRIHIGAIPIDEGRLNFRLKNKQIKLLEASSISLLGGVLNIKQFDWQTKTDDEPKVYFEGGMKDISLEQVSKALGWTPLSGNITGYIPGVDYENKKLTLNGEIQVNVFDGVIKINNLASSGLFSDFSKFYMDMEIDNLDLHALTQKFEMGSIEGRISGYIKNMYLENWEPITFFAWIGTPENDDSNHRISQRAVENIASIGGGGAADVISKGFLRFFDTFGYDQLGIGCYLNQGVCQLMGVGAAEQGYYLIKGGGIPRIDIVGYNPRVDWKVLMKRLARISGTDEVIVE